MNHTKSYTRYLPFAVIALLTAVLLIGAFWFLRPVRNLQKALNEGDYAAVVSIYNESIADKKLLEKHFHEDLSARITDTETAFFEKTVEYEEASLTLGYLTQLQNTELSELAWASADRVDLEHECALLHEKARTAYTEERFFDAMAAIKEIDADYTDYTAARTLYQSCIDRVLALVAEPTTEEEFLTCIALLEKGIKQTKEPAFSSRKPELETAYAALHSFNSIIQTATDLYESGYFADAFQELTDGLKSFPENEQIQSLLEDLQGLYVISIVNQVTDACAEKRYSDAIDILNNAIKEYDTESFRTLLDSVKQQKNLLSQLWNNLTDKVSGTVSDKLNDWQSEELSVQDIGSSAGSYVMKSGKKLMLGEYSDEKVTVLSLTGNILAAIANLDILFDLRDLSYDITHWGEDEYFVVKLAADVVALLPVVGVFKYLKYSDKVANAAQSVGGTAVTHSVIDYLGEMKDKILQNETVSGMTEYVTGIFKKR